MPFCGRSFRLTSLVCQHVDRTLPLEKLTNNHFHATHPPILHVLAAATGCWLLQRDAGRCNGMLASPLHTVDPIYSSFTLLVCGKSTLLMGPLN
jgi:hypothetical protein